MNHLREWLRRWIDEPPDICLDSLLERQRAGAKTARAASRSLPRYRSLSAIGTYVRREPAEANHASQA